MKKLTTALLTLLLALSLCACNLGTQNENPTEPPKPSTDYTIRFELNGGEVTEGVDSTVTVPLGETAKMPIPEKEGYVFVGWYLDAEFTNRYYFDYPLTGDTTLHAKFYDITLGEYIVISNVDQLMAVKDDPAAKYLLACDINCKGETLAPVDEFTGELDGNGYKIHNFAMNENAVNVALFRTNRGTVKNLAFDDFTYDIVRSGGEDKFYGVVCGINYGTVENCTILDGAINVTINSSGYNCALVVGGILGRNFGTVARCTNEAAINANVTHGGYYSWGWESRFIYLRIGGIIGANEADAEINNCTSIGDLNFNCHTSSSGGSEYYVGGITACNYGSIKQSTSISDIAFIGSGNNTNIWLGGAIGRDEGGNIIDCSAQGNITVETDASNKASNIGGFVGHTSGNLENCASQGEINVTNAGSGANYYMGGFVGSTCGKLYNCYSANNITDNTVDIKAIGGFAGFNEKLASEEFLINKCFATGSILVSNAPVNAGNFIGLSTGTEKECYYLDSMTINRITVTNDVETQLPVQTANDIGTGKAEAELLSVDFLENTLYFDRTAWLIVDGELPVLR